MALKATLRRAVKAAFSALDDVPKAATYHAKSGAPIRDLDAGTFTRTTVDIALKMVAFTRFSQKERDKDPAILVTDTKILIPTEDLKGTIPDPSHTITDEDGVLWELVRHLSDPASVLTILQARTS